MRKCMLDYYNWEVQYRRIFYSPPPKKKFLHFASFHTNVSTRVYKVTKLVLYKSEAKKNFVQKLSREARGEGRVIENDHSQAGKPLYIYGNLH